MIDDILFEFLHMETVHALVGQPTIATADETSVNVTKLEDVGYQTGYKFVEKLTQNWTRFKDELDIMKFICKEFWTCVFKKQVDNLRTNHQGVYVLLDNRFKFLSRVSNSKQFIDQMPRYLAFSCGLIRGALSNLGITAIVTADITTPPVAKFQIQVQSPVTK